VYFQKLKGPDPNFFKFMTKRANEISFYLENAPKYDISTFDTYIEIYRDLYDNVDFDQCKRYQK
jgi:hypothetical protein